MAGHDLIRIARKFHLAFAAILSFFVNAYSQPRLVDTSTERAFPSITFKKYVFENGLTLVVHEDHSDPVVQVDVTYHVGSARDTPGRTGFAHFFEHMMFQGSRNVREYFKTINEAGGFCNGTTNSDRTNYFQTVPSNQLEKVLWMEADRMGFLLDAVTGAKFDIQRSVIKNERDQRFTNRPYGLVNDVIAENLYGPGHPYSWPIVGYTQDLDSAGLEDVKQFFLQYYRPNNAILTVGGDVKTSDVLLLVGKYFGGIPAGKPLPKLNVPRQVLPQDKIVTHYDNVSFPMLQMVFPSVERFHADEAALDALAYLLAGNKNGVLSKSVLKSRIVNSVSVLNLCKELGGKFEVSASLAQGSNADSIGNVLRVRMENLADWDALGKSLDEFKAVRKVQLAKSLNTVPTKVFVLANCEVLHGDPECFRDEYATIEAMKMEDVRRVYEQYVKGRKCVFLKVLPGKQNSSFLSQARLRPVNPVEIAEVGISKSATPQIADQFDRSIMPNPGKPVYMESPKVWRHTFANGARMLGIRHTDTPLVSLVMTFDFSAYQTDNGKSNAEFYLLSQLLQRSGGGIPRETREARLGALGSELNVSMRPGRMIVEIQTLRINLDATMDILRGMLCDPLLDKDEFDQVKRDHLNYVARQSNLPEVIATNAFWGIIYDSKGPYGAPLYGRAEEVDGIGLEEIRETYQGLLNDTRLSIAVVGPVAKSDLTSGFKIVSRFGSRNQTVRQVMPENSTVGATRVFLVHKPNLTQSEIRVGYMLGIPYDVSGDYYLSTVANYTLGASFNSRLNYALREEKGWAYGARSQLLSSQIPGPFLAQAIVKGAATDSAVARMVHELSVFQRDGISKADLDFTKKSFTNFNATKFEAPFQKAFFLMEMLDYNAPHDFIKRQNKVLETLTTDQLSKNISQHFRNNNFVIVVVGDSTKIRDPLAKLGYPIIEL